MGKVLGNTQSSSKTHPRFAAAVIQCLVVGLAITLASCMTAGPTKPQAAPQGGSETQREYSGVGQDESLLGAMNKAKMDAVRKAVIDMVGVSVEQANHDALDEAIYSSKNPNAFVVNESLKKTRSDKDSKTNQYIYEASVLVRLDAVSATLKARGLTGEKVATDGKAATAAAESKQQTEAEAGKVDASVSQDSLSPAEQRIILDYVDHMTYMVYFAQKTAMDPFSAKSAIGIANEYLASNTMEAIDLDQIEKLKGDNQKVYEAETGESISITQWIAQKLNADVYIEIDGAVSEEKSAGKYYGQANITLKVFEASTGRLLGSVPWNSPKTMSTASSQAAVINALQTSVYKAMPIAITQAKAYMAKALTRGIKFELVIQKTQDSKLISTFRSRLKDKIKDLRVVSQTDEETRYEAYVIGNIEDLVDAVYNVSEKIPGLEGMKQVLLRGKSVTFNTGM